jgi:cytochrome c oxidase subunit 3
MWLFLAQEIMFFGGLFTAYLLYRWKYAEDFAIASSHLDWKLGMFNTAVLIISSLTMALAVRSSQTNDPKATVRWLILTGGLGGVFLLVKAYEYHHKWVDGIIPGLKWNDPFPDAPHAQMFYFIYFIMTGLHALHMVVGIGILGWLIRRRPRAASTSTTTTTSRLSLYWHRRHRVDFSLPLYLIRTARFRTLSEGVRSGCASYPSSTTSASSWRSSFLPSPRSWRSSTWAR